MVKIRKYLLPVLFCALILLGISPQNAVTSNIFETLLFPVNIEINDHELILSDPILNHNGKAYVPIRDFIEKLGGVISFNDTDERIQIHTPSSTYKKSDVSSMDIQDDFLLSIHSKKEQYTSNEMIDIWATIMYLGEDEIDIFRGEPLLILGIEDSLGKLAGDFQLQPSIRETFHQGDMHVSELSLSRVAELNSIKSELEWIDYIHSADRPWFLPADEYNVFVKARFSLKDGERIEMNTQLKIEVVDAQ